MKVFELFSKRQADAAKSGTPDVYQYENIPLSLRVQVKQIAIDAIGIFGVYGDRMIRPDQDNDVWVKIESTYLREKGLEELSRGDFAGERVSDFMRVCCTTDWLDLLELIALGINVMANDESRYRRQTWHVSMPGKPAIDEINYRLRQSQVGYQIESGRLIRLDSQFLHAEVVKPALSLISSGGFDGPREEFLTAHQHYRQGEYRQAVGMAANAVESTLKAIFDQKGWEYQKGARISDLVKIARRNSLWPEYLDGSFDQLVSTLQSGLPKIRDNDASHGQGSTPKNVPDYIASYALHLAASKIVFITEAAKTR